MIQSVVDEGDDSEEYELISIEGEIPESQITRGKGGSIDDDVFTAITEINNLDETNKFFEYIDEVECGDLEDIISDGVDYYQRRMDDRSFGQYKSWEEFAEEQVEGGMLGDVSETIKRYIDYNKLGSDLSFDYTMTESGYVFTDNY